MDILAGIVVGIVLLANVASVISGLRSRPLHQRITRVLHSIGAHTSRTPRSCTAEPACCLGCA
jgi:hypothetical protein